jgi:hypothetical protein
MLIDSGVARASACSVGTLADVLDFAVAQVLANRRALFFSRRVERSLDPAG